MSLEEETKKAMGFRSTKNSCSNCTYCKTRENQYVDREWYSTCDYSDICSFIIAEPAASICDKYRSIISD